MSNSVQPQRQQLTRLHHPWDSPGKNTGVGCHFLLQCMKVKSESKVAWSCPTLSDPMDCSLPGSSVHGIFQARVLEWGAIAFSRGILTLYLNGKIKLVSRREILIFVEPPVLLKLLRKCELLSCVQLFGTPMDCSQPDSSVHGTFQSRILEWVAIPSPRGSSQPRD